MSYLGQNEIPTFTYTPTSNGYLTPSSVTPIASNGNGVPWWKTAWGGVKEVLKTGAETFATVAPYVFDGQTAVGPTGTGPILAPTTKVIADPTTGRKSQVTYAPYTPGQTTSPGVQVITLPSGQQVTKSIKTAGVLPEWALPVGLAFGGFILFNMMRKKSR